MISGNPRGEFSVKTNAFREGEEAGMRGRDGPNKVYTYE
jgi:hypothetical protein